jgi:sulfite reductase (ferredoxin)
MDPTRVPVQSAATSTPKDVGTNEKERDCRGIQCPMNFVKVLYDLAKMQHGERLRVLLDDGPPIENVPRSVIREGHKVLEQVKVGDHWSILIEKA